MQWVVGVKDEVDGAVDDVGVTVGMVVGVTVGVVVGVAAGVVVPRDVDDVTVDRG